MKTEETFRKYLWELNDNFDSLTLEEMEMFVNGYCDLFVQLDIKNKLDIKDKLIEWDLLEYEHECCGLLQPTLFAQEEGLITLVNSYKHTPWNKREEIFPIIKIQPRGQVYILQRALHEDKLKSKGYAI